MFNRLRLIICFIVFSLTGQTAATTYVLSDDDIVGQPRQAQVHYGETLQDVGLRYNVGVMEMRLANPDVPQTGILPVGSNLIIPSQYILPSGPRRGIVINLAEFRLYYYPAEDNVVMTMPIGIGRTGWDTPIGITKVISKERDPNWYPSKKLQAEAIKQGNPIPSEFPGGEGNPLGRLVLRLAWPTYLLHGTNRENSVGLKVSAGCIRLLPEDIEELYRAVSVGTLVRIINEPVKVGRSNQDLFIQVYKRSKLDINKQAKLSSTINSRVYYSIIVAELKNPTGMPKKIA